MQLSEHNSGVLLQYKKPGETTGRIWIGLSGATIRDASGAPASAAEIRVGSTLAVWSTQAVAESDPAQTGADSIVIER